MLLTNKSLKCKTKCSDRSDSAFYLAMAQPLANNILIYFLTTICLKKRKKSLKLFLFIIFKLHYSFFLMFDVVVLVFCRRSGFCGWWGGVRLYKHTFAIQNANQISLVQLNVHDYDVISIKLNTGWVKKLIGLTLVKLILVLQTYFKTFTLSLIDNRLQMKETRRNRLL